MSSATRLGGFKILRGLCRVTLNIPGPGTGPGSAADWCRALSARRINLPYIALSRGTRSCRLTAMMGEEDAPRACRGLREDFGLPLEADPCAVLSLFPHRGDPEVPARLIRTLLRERVEVDTLAHSPAALSVGLAETRIERVCQSLFRFFSFSAYRTPVDWKLAQEGKEALYREVVASYQEKRPKVYGLDLHEGLALYVLESPAGRLDVLRRALDRLAARRIGLRFVNACSEGGKTRWSLCLPRIPPRTSAGLQGVFPPAAAPETGAPVAVFAMSGPHFGDRYGIAGELLEALESRGVNLRGLSCTVASVTGVVAALDVRAFLAAVLDRFEVPAVHRHRDPAGSDSGHAPAAPIPESS